MADGITVAELVAKWGFDIDDRSLAGLENRLGQIRNKLNPVIKGIAAVGAAAGAIITSVAAMVMTTAKAGDEAWKTSQKIGVNVERLQELQYAAKLADVESGELTVGLKYLSSRLYDASNGMADANRGFSELSIQVKDSSGNMRSADAVMIDLADRFAAMDDGSRKTALAVEIFGRQGMNLIPLLNSGSSGLRQMAAEARRLGVVIDEATTRRSEEFNDTLVRLKSVMIGLKREIGVALLPAFIRLAKGLLEWIKSNRELISLRITQFVQGFTIAMSTLAPVLGRAVELTDLLFDFLGRLADQAGDLSGIFKILATVLLGPFLIIDDIMAYFQGKDSLLGRFIALAQRELPALAEKVTQFFAPIDGIIRSVAEQLGYIVNFVQTLINLLKNPSDKFFESLERIWKINLAVMGWAGKGIGKGIVGGGRSLLETLNTASKGQADFLNWMNPATAPAATALAPAGAMLAGGLSSWGVSVGDIVVNVGGGGNAAETGAAVGSAVKENLDRVLRQAQRDLERTVTR